MWLSPSHHGFQYKVMVYCWMIWGTPREITICCVAAAIAGVWPEYHLAKLVAKSDAGAVSDARVFKDRFKRGITFPEGKATTIFLGCLAIQPQLGRSATSFLVGVSSQQMPTMSQGEDLSKGDLLST